MSSSHLTSLPAGCIVRVLFVNRSVAFLLLVYDFSVEIFLLDGAEFGHSDIVQQQGDAECARSMFQIRKFL
jgi:hypothetical protein